MTQPSTLDLTFPQNSLLFPSRSSPVICAADALEVIIELPYHIFNGFHIRDAALRVNWNRARRRLGTDVTQLVEIAGEKHPKTFAILLVATLLQAIKLWGCHGIFWTHVLAGIYLSSYLVLVGVGYLAPSNWRDYRSIRDDVRRESFDVVRGIFQYLAIASHAPLWIWACGQGYSYRYREDASLYRLSTRLFILAHLSHS